jgi:hypothetical protein
MATTLTAATQISHPLDAEYVLAGRPLRPDCTLEQTSRFVDDIWRLGPAIISESSLLKILNFAHIPARFRSTVKELFYAMLAGKLPPGEPRGEITTVRGHFTAITRFLRWLDTWPTVATGQPARRLVELVGADLQAYLKDLPRTQRSPATRERTRVSIRVLWRYRTVTPDHLLFDPAHLDDWADHYRRQPGENATDRIPEQVHGPLMVWALRFIDDFADDILSATEQWKKTRTALKGPILDDNTALLIALRRLLDDHIADNRPLPGRRGTINQFALAHSLGCSKSEIDRHRTLIYATAAVVGVDDQPWFNFPATSQLDGQLWIDRIVNDHRSSCGLGRLATLLQTAAYVTIAFLSGMRDSEIKDLRRGCLHVHRDDTGRVYRYKVISRAFKGEKDPRGVEATWVIGAPAARAIRVLERLQPPETDLLFAHHTLWGRANQLRGGQTRALTSGWTVTHLNAFSAWINDYCAERGRNDGIPLVNGRPWKLTTPQFRRTLAWFIARRPGGSIAGAIAYRHMSIQMFEGYAGTSDSGFRAEVESEQALARGEQLLAMIDRHEHTNLAGPAAAEATRRLEQLSQQTHYRGTVITDQRRLRRLIARNDPAIYPDKYVTCVHTHATALCQQRHDQRGTLRPDIGSCKPLSCRNVALTPDNIDNLRAEITQIDGDLGARPLLPPLLRHQLTARRNDIEAFLTRNNPEHT